MQKFIYIPAKSKVLYKTKYNAYFGENIKLIPAVEFITLLTAHIPAKHNHLIRYYGLYSSRTKGKAKQDGSLKKHGFGINKGETSTEKPEENPLETITEKQAKSTWARLMVRL